jgi:hypothetical protein
MIINLIPYLIGIYKIKKVAKPSLYLYAKYGAAAPMLIYITSIFNLTSLFYALIIFVPLGALSGAAYGYLDRKIQIPRKQLEAL